ncbi:MAG: FAD-dependent oxidoreductase [Acidiferrobacteraceae bacterium]
MSDYDLCVIGGGIHGAGVAQAAAAAGHSVLLLESHALAYGASGRSSKLIHGGLRYLETGEWGLVREALRERELLLRLAPRLVQRMPFFVPVYLGNRHRPSTIGAGLALYALLAGLRRSARFSIWPRASWDRLDGLNTHGLSAVFRYFDAQTDDRALTEAVTRSAATLGAEIHCGTRFVHARRERDEYHVEFSGRVSGTARARALVNAGGAWASDIAQRIEGGPASPPIALVRGTHIIGQGDLTRGVYYVEAEDGRPVLIMPHTAGIIIGTTEMAHDGRPDGVVPSSGEVDYLERTFRHYFPAMPWTTVSAVAGLRVLPIDGPVGARARRARLVARDACVGIYGGKLTTYRVTAQRALARIRAALPRRRAVADTAKLPLDPAS